MGRVLAPHMWLPEFNCWNPQEELDAVASIWNSHFPNLEMEDRDGRCVQTLTGQPVWSRLPREINNRRDTASVKGKSRGDSPKLPFVLTCKLWTQTDLNEMQLSLKPHHLLATFEVLSPGGYHMHRTGLECSHHCKCSVSSRDQNGFQSYINIHTQLV